MTTKTTDFTGLLYYNPVAQGFNPAVSATLTNDATVDEGAALTFDIVTWNVADNDSVFYKVTSTSITPDRFDTVAGPIAIVGNRGSFTITVNADSATAAGVQTYNVAISKAPNGSALAIVTITVNDTSQSAPTGVDFFYAGDQNNWIAFGGLQSGSTFSNPAPAFTSYTYPDGSYTGHTRDFDGTTWMASTNLQIGNAWQTNAITIDYWFYPTAYNVQLMSESDHPDVTTGYHYSLLEIDSNGYVYARFYNGSYNAQPIISQLPVILNKWNHIWFTEDLQGNHAFELNGVPTTGNTTFFRVRPDIGEYFVIGEVDVTTLGASSTRFQGKIGWLNIRDYPAASTWNDQRNRFRPSSQFYTAQFNTEAPPGGGTFATFIWPTVLQNVVGWKMYGLGAPQGTTVISQSDNGIQTTMTVSPEIVYHATVYTFVAP